MTKAQRTPRTAAVVGHEPVALGDIAELMASPAGGELEAEAPFRAGGFIAL